MTTWILILALYTSSGPALMNVNIESESACIKAGNAFKAMQPFGTKGTYACVKGWEITND